MFKTIHNLNTHISCLNEEGWLLPFHTALDLHFMNTTVPTHLSKIIGQSKRTLDSAIVMIDIIHLEQKMQDNKWLKLWKN